MIDIEKEREAFEAIPKNARLLRGAKFKDGEYVALSLFDESSKELAAQLNYGWEVWLSAKAQAVPGQICVTRERLQELIEIGVKAALEAKEPSKAQAVQSKQDLLDRVNARWQLAHEQCAENWNTYSSAQMDAFDWVEQDIKELLGEAQEPNND